MGVSLSEAKETFVDLLANAKADAERLRAKQTQDNMGDTLLATEAANPAVQRLLSEYRSDGARDQDIRDWWNKTDLERCFVAQFDNFIRMAHFFNLLHKGNSPDEAGAIVKKNRAYYGSPRDEGYDKFGTGDDRFLPYVLRDRVNRWILSCASTPEKFDAGSLRTFNALVRREIRCGNI
jgi:hypothetical protein